MGYCIKCGYKNPDTNRFCIACGEPLYTSQPGEQEVQHVKQVQEAPNAWRAAMSNASQSKRQNAPQGRQPNAPQGNQPTASQGKRRKPEKKRSGRWKSLVGLFAVIGLAVWGISSLFGDSDEENVCEISFEEEDMVSDFQMEDIDWLQDYALYCSLLNQECLKTLSNGFHDGEFFTGIGEYSDDSAFNEVLQHLIENRENYEAAFSRLEATDILGDEGSGLLSFNVYGHPHNLAAIPLFTASAQATGKKPGWLREKLTWLSNKALGFEIDNAEMMSTLREMGAFRDKQIQKDIFESINPENRGGYTNASEFFKALNRDEMMEKRGYMYGNILKNLSNESERTYEKWKEAQKSLGCEKEYADHFMDVAKDLVNDAAKAEMTIIDKLSGGGISNVKKLEELAENAKAIKELLNGEAYFTAASEKEVKKRFKKLLMDKLREKMPETGSKAADKLIDFFSDYLENKALEDDKSDKEAKEQKRALLVVETPDGTKNVVVRDENGNIKVLVPGDDGYTKIVSSPGIKLITIVSKDGKRTKTKKVKVKKGKNTIGRKKPKNNSSKKAGVDPNEPKDGHWKLFAVDPHANNNGEYFKGVKMTVSPGRFHMSSKCTEDTYPGPFWYYKHDNCKGEFLESTATYTEPKQYYTPGENVVINYSTSTSSSKFTDGIIGTPLNIDGDIATPITKYKKFTNLTNEEGKYIFQAISKTHEESHESEYTDVHATVRGAMPEGHVGDTIHVNIGASHGRGEDALMVVYRYVWVPARAKKESDKKKTDEYSGNGIHEREPEFVEGSNSLGIDPKKENITIPM